MINLLEKWENNLIIQPAAETNELEKKLTLWHELCPIGISVVISGLLSVYKVCSRPLEDQILDPKVINSTYDLFATLNPDDADLKSITSQLNATVISQ